MWLRTGGYTVRTGPLGKEFEADTFTCKHCCRVVLVAARCDPAELGGYCNCCDALICKYCVGKPCTPLEKKLDLYERGVLKVLR